MNICREIESFRLLKSGLVGKGLVFKFVEFKPAAIQVTGDVAVACYWTKYKWTDKDGGGVERTVRITHTWIKTGNKWEIIGGMSMAESSTPQK